MDRADITVIEIRRAGCRAPRNISNSCAGLLIVLFLVTVFWAPPVHSELLTPGIVTKGTFLLSSEPNVRREGRFVYGNVGYLPVGTRVYHSGKVTKIRSYAEGNWSRYYEVYSSIGITGLLKEGRFVTAKNNPLAVVVSSYEVAYHNPDAMLDPDPANGQFKKMGTIGRYGGHYFEITDASDPNFYQAVLHRSGKTGDRVKEERVRLLKRLVEGGAAIKIEPEQVEKATLPIPVWSEFGVLEDEFINSLIEKLRAKIGAGADQARSLLTSLDNLQCLVKASAEINAGISVFGNGMSFKLASNIKDQDYMFQFGVRTLEISSSKQRYTFFKGVKCDGGEPERLQRLVVQEGVFDVDRRLSVRLRDVEKNMKSEWITSLVGNTVPFRMIQIKDESSYLVSLRKLDTFVSDGGGYISQLAPAEKEVLLNLILREIAYFSSRDVFVTE